MRIDELKTHALLWFQAIRPRTLALSVSPVILGTALVIAEQDLKVGWYASLLIMLAAIAIQAGTNLFNDSADYINGTDTDMRVGPQRITASGLATPDEVMRAGYSMFLLAGLIGLYLVWLGGVPILLLGILSLIAGYSYSHGPWPISRTPLGELFVILFFGIGAVLGTYFIYTHEFRLSMLLWGLVIGLPAAAVLLVNNTRDLEGDTLAGRRTLAIILNLHAVRMIYTAMMLLPFLLIFLAVTHASYPVEVLWGWVAFPVFIGSCVLFWKIKPGMAMNALLGKTVLAQIIMTGAISIGLVYSQFAI